MFLFYCYLMSHIMRFLTNICCAFDRNELLVAVDLRLTALKEELAAAVNRASGSKCSPEDIYELGNFALHIGAKNLRYLFVYDIFASISPFCLTLCHDTKIIIFAPVLGTRCRGLLN